MTDIERYGIACRTPEGAGFQVLAMPDYLLHSTFDDCSPHTHDFFEILWFQQGEGCHIVDFAEYEVRPDTVFFLAPGQIHYFDNKLDKAGGRCSYKGVSIQMCSDFMNDETCSGNEMIKYNAFYTFDTAPYFHLDKDTAQELSILAHQMEEESHRSEEFGNTDILRSLLRIFLVKVLRHGEQDVKVHLNIMKPSHQLFVHFRKLVEQEYRQTHTVQEYAEKLNVAVRTLDKCVNECAQISPLTFINNRIILEAKRLIKYSNMMIKEISFHLGFEDPSYFVKLFKRKTGYLPSDFRELDQVTNAKKAYLP